MISEGTDFYNSYASKAGTICTDELLMPKIYEYLGYVLFIYTDDHMPIHVHVQYAEYESKVELHFEDEVLTLKVRKIRGVKLLPASNQKEINRFIENYAQGIVDKWVKIHVLKTKVKNEKITKKL
ncbi:DUF4160 domain-containing protein [Fibrella aquatica]|uniref:DUF4160 domain-containing protein n=1 Tax=Fibrella aquatica TaxID=3242487 RepID=UPI003521E6D8